MSYSAVSLPLTRSTPRTNRGLRSSVFILLALWFALSFTLGARGVFINRPGTPPLALLAAVVVPIAVFLVAPAGLGDMAIGVTAPWVALALTRNPRFATSKPFVAWNIFGIFDFAVLAVGMGAIAPLIFPRLLQTVTPQMMTAAPMRHLPLSMVPSFLVPMFTIFHLIALFQTRRAQVSRPM